MLCERASEMMSERLNGRLDSAEMACLEDHLAVCSACQTEWRRMRALDRLLTSAPMMRAPIRLRVRVMARIGRKERVRRAITGGTVLALGTLTLALLVLAPAFFDLLETLGVAPALISGGPETVAQLLALLNAIGHMLLVLADQFAAPLAFLSVCVLVLALVLNGLWVGTLRRLRAAH